MNYMDARAKLRFYRQSPRKVRMVVDVIRGMYVKDALAQLANMQKRAARAVAKLLNSAVANAKNITLDQVNDDELRIKEIRVDQGPTYKRYMPRAHGRATMIRKKTSHIYVVITDGKDEKVSGQIFKSNENKTDKSEKKKTEKNLKERKVANKGQESDKKDDSDSVKNKKEVKSGSKAKIEE